MAKRNGKMIALSVCCALALLLSAGALARQLAKETTKELSATSYAIGAVTAEGEIDSKDKTAITSDKLKVKDLVSIEIEEDAEVSVVLHWYDEDDELLSSSVVTDEKPVGPEGAEYFRVEIEPTDDDDGEVSFFEKGSYANLVTVTLKK